MQNERELMETRLAAMRERHETHLRYWQRAWYSHCGIKPGLQRDIVDAAIKHFERGWFTDQQMTDFLGGKLRTVNMYLNRRLGPFFEHLRRGGMWRIRPEYPPPSSQGRHPAAEFRLEPDEGDLRLPCGCRMVREADDAIAFYSCYAHDNRFHGQQHLQESFAMS